MFEDLPDWYDDAECAKPENQEQTPNFFANKPSKQYQAKKLCGACPVRKDCTQWALNNKQIWGIWGGLGPEKIRRTLSVNWEGQEMRHKRFPICPYCKAKTESLGTKTVDRPDAGRWSTMKVVYCKECSFSWQSRTSANAVEAYYNQEDRKKKKLP
jgi:WhiB family redox-sensing transcriptional regulator